MNGRYSRWNAGRPRPAPAHDPSLADTGVVARIGLVAQNGRPIWFGLLAYLAFVTMTLLSVRDIDFFSLESRTTLPIVNIAIPTTTFFWTAAWLGAAFHAFLHLYLLKLWDPLAEAPARVGGRPLGEVIHPWLVCDWALRRRPDRDHAITPRPMACLADWVARVMLWLAAPLVLLVFWGRSMPAHDEWLTLTIAGALLLSLYASRKGWRRATARLRDPGASATEATGRAAWPGRLGFAAVALLLAAISWARTEGGFDHHANWLIDEWEEQLGPVFEDGTDANGGNVSAQEVQERWVAAHVLTLDDLSQRDGDGRIVWTPLAPIDLIDADLAHRPADWLNRDTAERRFRVVWCRDRAIPPEACHAPREDDFVGDDDAFAAARAIQARARKAWCAAEGRALDAKACPAHFASLDRAFDAEWSEQRDGALANLSKPAMRGRDLRGAQARGAFLAGLDLREARMEGAVLIGARMEGADLRRARLEGAILFQARMEGAVLRWAHLEGAVLHVARMERADLSEAWMEGADLRGARMERADLHVARMEGANLREARMEGAVLRWARMDGADLSWARMEGADLSWAWMEGADLSGARMKGAVLIGAHLEGAILSGADLTGGRNLTQSQLDLVTGNDDTILPRDAETDAQLHVWSCWETLPPTLDALLARLPGLMRDRRRTQWLCPPGEAPRKVGRPAPG